MKTEDIINLLKINNYSFEIKENMLIIRLARQYFLKLYIENDTIVKSNDMVKRLTLLTYGKSLKAAVKTIMIGYLIFILLFALWCILDPYFFSSGGKYFFITMAPIILCELLVFLYNNRQLSKIKTLLNLND